MFARWFSARRKLRLLLFVWMGGWAFAEDEFAAGLIATYNDADRAVSRVVALPELGLAADESPHPAIGPAFRATFECFLRVERSGRYAFGTNGTLEIAGEPVLGEVALKAGRHPLRLSYRRSPGPVRLGLSWRSDHFVEEPVPPGVLSHRKPSVVPEDPPGDHPSPPHRMEWAMQELKCASCHDPDFLATMHHKFTPDALLTHIRHANPMKWYGAMTGPLLEESEMLDQLVADLHKLPGPKRQRGDAAADPQEGRRMVGAREGLACVACHDIKHHRTAAETKGPNLGYVTRRVSYDWFVRWMNDPQRLKPGVPMPAFFAGQPPDERQRKIDALWDYLSQGDAMALPDELVADPERFVLVPQGGPMVHRVYLRLPDGRELLRAITVGLPDGPSYAFDAETCRLAYVWNGGYLDMSPHWQNQSLHPVVTLGEPLYLPGVSEGLRVGEKPAVFRGYELIAGVPRFEFTFGETPVRLRIDAPSSGVIRQTFEIGSTTEPVSFVGPPRGGPVRATASAGEWNGNRLTLDSADALVIESRRKSP